MKHSELLNELKNRLGESFTKITKVIKGTSSGFNYLSIKFENQKDLESIKKIIPRSHKCEKRFGIGLIINQYNLFKI